MLKVYRTHYADDWHCGTQGCGCWRTKDIERDKALLAKVFGEDGKLLQVSYSEYKRNPEEGSESRDRNIFYVTVKKDLIVDSDLSYVAWHGFHLSWIAAYGKNYMSLAFERIGIWEEETPEPRAY